MIFGSLKLFGSIFSESTHSSEATHFKIMAVQHLMETTGSLFEYLIHLGFVPQNIFLTGKVYSTHKPTVEKLKQLGINIFESTVPKELGTYGVCLEKDVKRMWDELGKQLKPNDEVVVLDDGGFALQNVPGSVLGNHKVYGIEQTKSGIRFENTFSKMPVINVAASAAKTLIEPAFVAEAVHRKLGNKIRDLNPASIGIVGLGHVGKAMADDLGSKFALNVFDENKNMMKQRLSGDIKFCKNIAELYEKSELIVGATGNDISNETWITKSSGSKILMSVSSGDIEFKSLLKLASKYLVEPFQSPLDDLKVRTPKGHRIIILRGGMVSNFNGDADSSSSDSIQMTRALLYSAFLQIIRDKIKLNGGKGNIMLAPDFQMNVVNSWFELLPERKSLYSTKVVNGFREYDFVQKNSSGKLLT